MLYSDQPIFNTSSQCPPSHLHCEDHQHQHCAALIGEDRIHNAKMFKGIVVKLRNQSSLEHPHVQLRHYMTCTISPHDASKHRWVL